MNKKIIILTNTLKTGGAEKQSIYLFNALSRRYDTLLIVYYGDQKDHRMIDLLAKNLIGKVIFLEGTHFRKLNFLFKIFKTSKETICISYLATTNAINAIVGKIAGVKFRIGGIRSSRFPWFKKIAQRHLHNFWLHISVFNNYQGLEVLTKSGFNPAKATVIHNAVEIPNIKITKHELVTILSVGRFVGVKDYITSINSVKIVNQFLSGFKYLIVGQGELENEIKSYITALGLSDVVELVINPENVNQFYEQADIYLSTSVFEGLSNAIMEAMSFGLPIIATDVGDNKYLVQENVNGFLTQVKDVNTIASKLELLIKNAELRHSMGVQGRLHVKINFSIDKFTDHYVQLIESFGKEN